MDDPAEPAPETSPPATTTARTRRPSPAAMAGAAAVLVVAGAAAWWGLGRGGPPTFHGTFVESPGPATDFRLVSEDGPVALGDYRGKVVVLFFGYTFCPDVCPTTLAVLARALDLMGGDADDVQVIMVSVDPERDPPDRLASYVHQFDPRFVGLTGTSEEIARAAATYGVFYRRQEGEGDAYLVDHLASALALDAEGRLRLVISYGTRAEDIATDLRSMLGL